MKSSATWLGPNSLSPQDLTVAQVCGRQMRIDGFGSVKWIIMNSLNSPKYSIVPAAHWIRVIDSR